MKKLLFFIVLSLLLILLVGCDIIFGKKQQELPKGKSPTTIFVLDKADYFTDHAIFQANKDVVISGVSQEGVIISVTLYDSKNRIIDSDYDIVKSDGSFSIVISGKGASFEEYRLVISDSVNTLELNSLKFGEVLLVIGDGLVHSFINDFEEEQEDINNNLLNDHIGIYNVTLNDSQWLNDNDPDYFNQLSKFSYVLATEYQDSVNSPIAVINATVDSSHIDAWLDRQTINDNLSIKNFIINNGRYLEESEIQNDLLDQMTYLNNHLIEPILGISINTIIWNNGSVDVEITKEYTEQQAAEYYRYYTYVLNKFFDCLRSVIDANILVLQAPSSTTTHIEMLRQTQSSSSFLYSFIDVIPTYDLHQILSFEDESPIIIGDIDIELLIERIVLFINDKNQLDTDNYAPSYTHCVENGFTIQIQISNTIALSLSDDGTTIKNLVVLDQNNQECLYTFAFNDDWLVLTIEDEEFIKIESISYAWNPSIYDSNLVNEKGIPIIPFKIYLD